MKLYSRPPHKICCGISMTLIAYVSQFFTLKIGDIIFTGTPSGVSRVQPNDSLKGYIGEEEFFSIKVK